MKTTNDSHAERLALLENQAELLQQDVHALDAKFDALLAAIAELCGRLGRIDANTLTSAAIGEMLIEAADVTRLKGLNPKTISASRSIEKFNEPGRRRILISLRAAAAIKPRRRRKE
ncbi:MAG: hypothetical protein KF762_17240 [Acidobacteria bacterium]|nr:hypothetical protein [Acidobacteriota bacterium]